MKKITIRLDEEEHKIIKKHLIDIDKTFQEYITELIKKDLKNK